MAKTYQGYVMKYSEKNRDRDRNSDLDKGKDKDKDKAHGLQGIIFNIQRYTIHDGPGIRTEVFFKGCPLQCKWCSNPESFKREMEVGVYSDRCIGYEQCGYCTAVCPKPGTIVVQENKVQQIDREKCTGCLQCAEACPANALMLWGKKMTIAEVMKIIESDRDFYEKSGGGVTLSGGDVLMQWEFARELLSECKDRGIHTCIESSMHYRTEVLEALFPFVDLVIADLKHMDSDLHKAYTGVDNALILHNIRRTADLNMPLIIRIPVVPYHNNSEENIRATAGFIMKELQNRVLQVQLLPYRPMGTEKYLSLGLDYPMDDVKPVERSVWEENILHLAEIMRSYGIAAEAGTTSKIQ